MTAKADPGRSISMTDVMRFSGVDRIEKEKSTDFKDNAKYAKNVHSAIFAEVKIDELLGVVRVTRIVTAVTPPGASSIRKPLAAR